MVTNHKRAIFSTVFNDGSYIPSASGLQWPTAKMTLTDSTKAYQEWRKSRFCSLITERYKLWFWRTECYSTFAFPPWQLRDQLQRFGYLDFWRWTDKSWHSLYSYSITDSIFQNQTRSLTEGGISTVNCALESKK